MFSKTKECCVGSCSQIGDPGNVEVSVRPSRGLKMIHFSSRIPTNSSVNLVSSAISVPKTVGTSGEAESLSRLFLNF